MFDRYKQGLKRVVKAGLGIRRRTPMQAEFDRIAKSFGRAPREIVHIGSNHGQEAAGYAADGVRAHHVEALPDVAAKLKTVCDALPGQICVQACLSDRVGETVFHVSSNEGASSSMFAPGDHLIRHPKVVFTHEITMPTTTLDIAVRDGALPPPEFIVIDVQGAEVRVLSGGEATLTAPRCWGLCVEVSLTPLYKGGASFRDVDAHLNARGFYLNQAIFNRFGWTDATYLRRWWPAGDGEIPPLMKSLSGSA